MRRALSFLVQCGDAGPLLNIMGLYQKQMYHKQGVETDKEDGQVNGEADREEVHVQQNGEEDEEEDQVEDAAHSADEAQKLSHSRSGGVFPGGLPAKKARFNNWQNKINNLQKQISEDLLPNYERVSFDQTEKQKSSRLGFAENRHSDILDKQIDKAINAVMGEKNVNKPTTFSDDEARLIQDVKLEQEESHLVEFFEEKPENTLEEKQFFEEKPENSLALQEKKFVKANRRVFTLEKSLLRANRRVYNLPTEVIFFFNFFIFFKSQLR